MTVTYRHEFIRCGKKNCRQCPHGPYWYAYWREGKKLRKRYVGKNRPDDQDSQEEVDGAEPGWEKVFNAKTISANLCYSILGILPSTDYGTAKKMFAKLCMVRHPDRGGNTRLMQMTNVAWDFVKKLKGWGK